MYDPITAGVLFLGTAATLESQKQQKNATRQQQRIADKQFKLQEEAAKKEEARLAKEESDIADAEKRASDAASDEKKRGDIRRGRGSTIIAGQTSDLQNLAKLGAVRKRKLGAGAQ